jgi:DNA-3-methyladenine glycosylase I
LTVQRCSWARNDVLMAYHDLEWGVPINDDRLLFEFLVLEGMQAGLTWENVLKRRSSYRAAFDHFDPTAIAAYDRRKVEILLADQGIIRNRLKIAAAIGNAKMFVTMQKEFGTFDRYVWGFVDGRPRQNAWRSPEDVPAQTNESMALSKDLRRRGFTFVGPTICYAFMQAVGMVNDHLVGCFRYEEVKALG